VAPFRESDTSYTDDAGELREALDWALFKDRGL
jgi:hypothetical protein